MKIEDTQIKVGTFITSPEVYLFLRKKSLDEFKRIAGSAVTYTDENEEMFLNAWRRSRVEQLVTKHPEVADLDPLLRIYKHMIDKKAELAKSMFIPATKLIESARSARLYANEDFEGVYSGEVVVELNKSVLLPLFMNLADLPDDFKLKLRESTSVSSAKNGVSLSINMEQLIYLRTFLDVIGELGGLTVLQDPSKVKLILLDGEPSHHDEQFRRVILFN